MADPLSDEQIARLRELTEAATPGPWGWRGNDDGHVELCALHSGYPRIISAQRGEPCIVELGDGSVALTIEACVRCMRAFSEPEVEHLDRCEKPENLGTVWLWDGRGFVHPANEWAVREQPYRSDVAAVEHPDAEFIAAAREAVPALLAEIDRLKTDLETAEDDVLRAISERNEVARIAAAEIHPGPDGADDEIRRGLIRDWLDEGRDDAEGWREKFQRAVLKPCPHIQTSDDGTSHCSLAEAACDRAEEATS